MPILAWVFEALESWGITHAVAWVTSFFKRTPAKDMESAHEVEIKDAAMSDADKRNELRDEWTKKP